MVHRSFFEEQKIFYEILHLCTAVHLQVDDLTKSKMKKILASSEIYVLRSCWQLEHSIHEQAAIIYYSI